MSNGRGSVLRGRVLPLLVVMVAVLAVALAWEAGIAPDHAAGYDVPAVESSADRDGDGIDDQADILQGARDYVATRPTYRSAYFDGGYPTDGTGVCTDVVAQALLAAGYDLRELVDDDVRLSPESYDIDAADKNIDFRRVRNLNVWLSRNALSLTTDPTEIDQWQGGDIVVFRDHIGVVSDKRDFLGRTYVIHHSGPLQLSFEQDLLVLPIEVVGHYRIG